MGEIMAWDQRGAMFKPQTVKMKSNEVGQVG